LELGQKEFEKETYKSQVNKTNEAFGAQIKALKEELLAKSQELQNLDLENNNLMQKLVIINEELQVY
jgi:hypothetical protein